MKAVSDLGVVLCVCAGNEDQAVGEPAPCDDYRVNSKGELINEYKKGYYCYPPSYLNLDSMIVVAAASQDATGKIIRSAEGNGEAGSNYSSNYVDITAPGSHIISTIKPGYKFILDEQFEEGVNNYASWSGTSMAAPYVAGAVALLKSAYPDATGNQIKRAILESANGNYCKNDSVTYSEGEHINDSTSKYGFLDVYGAYELLAEIIEEDAKNSSSSSSSGGCNSNELGIKNILILCAFILLSLGIIKFKRS